MFNIMNLRRSYGEPKVSNHNDGVTGASLFAFNDLFLRLVFGLVVGGWYWYLVAVWLIILQRENSRDHALLLRTKALQQSSLKRRTMMKLAFKVGEGGNHDKEIEDLADEEDSEGEGDVNEEEGKKDEASKPGLLRRVRESSKRTVSGMMGTRMTNPEVTNSLFYPNAIYFSHKSRLGKKLRRFCPVCLQATILLSPSQRAGCFS